MGEITKALLWLSAAMALVCILSISLANQSQEDTIKLLRNRVYDLEKYHSNK